MIKKQIELQQKINKLDKNKIHLLFFEYSMKENWLSKPFLPIIKLFFKLQNKPTIDHVCHISRFIYDNETGNWIARIFETTLSGGRVEENDLFERLKNFKGKIYIQTLQNVNKIKAREFEKKYIGIPYSIILAGLSGIDFKFFNSKNKSNEQKASFCSSLEALFLIDQNYDLSKIENGNPSEITPNDIFLYNLGETEIFFKS